MSLHDAKSYKIAKIIAKDLKDVLILIKQLEQLMTKLKPYRRYKYVNTLILSFLECKSILEIQHKKYQEVFNEKGKIS